MRGSFYYLGSHTNKYGKVEHFFTAGAVSTAQRKRTYRGDWAYSEYPNSAGHAIQIENRDPSTANLIAVDQPGRLGAWPPESDDDEYSWDSLAFTVVAGAVGAGSSLLGFGLSAAAAVSSMANSQRTDSGDSQHFGWTFTGSDLPCETVHYCNFTMECFKGETQATVRVDEMTGDQTEDNDIIELGFWNSVNALSARAQNEDSVPTAGTTEFTQYCEQSPEFKKVWAEDHPWRGLVSIQKSEGPFYIAANPTVEGGLAK